MIGFRLWNYAATLNVDTLFSCDQLKHKLQFQLTFSALHETSDCANVKLLDFIR